MMDLDEIRKVFPTWPSELEAAKQSTNWAGRAQSFYCAAVVLNEEREKAHQRAHAETGRVITEAVMLREQVDIAAYFCLAFSLELATKAALTNQGALAELKSGKKIPFLSHSIHELAKKVAGLNLSQEEGECLKKASAFIAYGKYPAGIAPCESRNGVPSYPHFQSLFRIAGPLYQRLMELGTTVNAQHSAADGPHE